MGVSVILLTPNGIDPLPLGPRQLLAFAGLKDVEAVHRFEAAPQLGVEITKTAPAAGKQLIQVHAAATTLFAGSSQIMRDDAIAKIGPTTVCRPRQAAEVVAYIDLRADLRIRLRIRLDYLIAPVLGA